MSSIRGEIVTRLNSGFNSKKSLRKIMSKWKEELIKTLPENERQFVRVVDEIHCKWSWMTILVSATVAAFVALIVASLVRWL